MILPSVQFIPGYVSFQGGIDVVAPPMIVPSGYALTARNYTADRSGGYSRIDGYERLDGRPAPSSQNYLYCPATFTGEVFIGDMVVSSISGAQGVVIYVGIDHIDIANVTGTWGIESFSVDGVGKGTITALPSLGGELTPAGNAQALSNTADLYRASILAVPGTGPIRGVVSFKGVVYAFRDLGSSCKMYKSTADGWVIVLTPALLAGGRYEFVIYNFTGSSDTIHLYGCDGVNKAFKFTGDTFTQITTGMTVDKPQHIAAWKKYLILTFKGSLQISSLGDPLTWSALTGAAEIGMGDDITGLLVQPGDALAVFARNSTFALSGTVAADFQMSTISDDVGCREWTAQNLGSAFCLDDRGIVKINTTETYGNFAQATISTRVQPILSAMKSKVVASAVYKDEDQYRLYCNDGSGLIMTLPASGKGYYYSTFQYPVAMNCAFSGEDSGGLAVLYMGGTDGFVYQAKKGSSFDGEGIEAVLRTTYNNFNAPALSKRFRNSYLELSTVGFSEIFVSPDFSYSDPLNSRQELTTVSGTGHGGIWDSDSWESFYYDSAAYVTPKIAVTGVGNNIGITFYTKSKLDLGHTINGMTINYTPLKVKR